MIIDSSSSAAPVDDHAVGRDPAARADQDHVAHGQLGRSAPSWSPSPVTRSASSGSSAASASRALEAWPRARISSQWPSSMITISRASSHQNSRSKAPNTVATLAPKATRMAREISSIMPGWRLRSSARPPSRNGRPP